MYPHGLAMYERDIEQKEQKAQIELERRIESPEYVLRPNGNEDYVDDWLYYEDYVICPHGFVSEDNKHYDIFKNEWSDCDY